MKPTLLVLAAGIGSRYGGFKQIAGVAPGGEVLLDYALFDAWRAGFGKVVFVVRPELEKDMRDHFDACLAGKLASAYVYQRLEDLPEGAPVVAQREKPWGTGHAVWAARHEINEPFAVVNADDFYGASSYQALADFLTSTVPGAPVPTFAMVGFRLRRTLSEFGGVARGICRTDGKGFLTRVTERTGIEKHEDGAARFPDSDGTWQSLTGDEVVSMNIWGFTPTLFPLLETEFAGFLTDHGKEQKTEFFMPTVVDSLIQRGGCRTAVLHTDADWFGITYREDRPLVVDRIRRLIETGKYPSQLWG